jgi:uncharacterized protein with von Willebrand factor type A (vWA) domain
LETDGNFKEENPPNPWDEQSDEGIVADAAHEENQAESTFNTEEGTLQEELNTNTEEADGGDTLHHYVEASEDFVSLTLHWHPYEPKP